MLAGWLDWIWGNKPVPEKKSLQRKNPTHKTKKSLVALLTKKKKLKTTIDGLTIGETKKICNQLWKRHRTIKSGSYIEVPISFARIGRKWTAGEFALTYMINHHFKQIAKKNRNPQ